MTLFTDGMSGLPLNPHIAILGESSTMDEIFLSTSTRSNISNNNNKIENGVLQNMAGSSRSSRQFSCYQASLGTVLIITVMCMVIVLCRHYIHSLLLWVETADVIVGLTLFLALFTVVSFPLTFGYFLLMIAAGYLYGAIYGAAVIIVCGTFGCMIAHLTIRRCCKSCIHTRFSNDKMEAIVKVMKGNHGFRVIALTRLTPIPFGLQNGLFAITNIAPVTYCLASFLGIIPTSLLNSYMGSTIRSMEDVLSDDSHQLTAYLVFAAQILISICLMTFVVRKARMELKKTMELPTNDFVDASMTDVLVA